MPRYPSRFFLTCLLISTPALPAAGGGGAAEGPSYRCGTEGWLVEQLLERTGAPRRTARPAARAGAKALPLSTAAKTELRQEGNVAVAINDDGRLFREQNLVDLENGFAMQFKFKKKQGGYQVKRGGGFNDDVGERLALADDDSFEIVLPFNVKFFGKRYDSLFVNSDGNVTFGRGDAEITPRDVSRLLDGPPRLAPFFADLNPETAPADGGVFAQVGGKSVRVTWLNLPEFDRDGFANTLNTFQLTLVKNGKVTFAYGDLGSREGLVGIAPGDDPRVSFLDYTAALPAPPSSGAIVESFADEVQINEEDEVAIVQAFLENFADRYKSLVVFTDFPLRLRPGFTTIAYELTVKNDIRGIGESQYDASRFYGSSGAFESFVMMGDIDKYGDDIDDLSQVGGKYSPLEILMHELGHRWGVSLLFDHDGEISKGLLGRGEAHWSYCFNSENSYLEGNKWADDDGDGIYAAVRGPASFNDFDLYSIGLLGADSVEPSFLIGGNCNGDRAPSFSGAASGEIVDVAIEDVVAALGERRPAFPDAPQKFEIAFLLLVQSGQEPRAESIALVNEFRKGVERRLAEQGGKFVTKLRAKK